jgi:lysophospholipase L1-like esterase
VSCDNKIVPTLSGLSISSTLDYAAAARRMNPYRLAALPQASNWSGEMESKWFAAQAISLALLMVLLTACGTLEPTLSPTPTPTSAVTIDLVALGDSTPAGWGVVESYVDIYARYVETDLGVAVRVHNWARYGQRASELLVALQSDQALRDAISEAEVITIWTGMNDVFVGIGSQPKGGVCGNWKGLDLDCVGERVERLKENIDAIIAEILSLCSSDDVLVLIADVGNPYANQWKEMGLLDELKGPVMEEWIDHIAEAAEENNVSVVHTYRVLNGPTGEEGVPSEIMQTDGLHFSGEGHRLLADLHRQAGYGPLKP